MLFCDVVYVSWRITWRQVFEMSYWIMLFPPPKNPRIHLFGFSTQMTSFLIVHVLMTCCSNIVFKCTGNTNTLSTHRSSWWKMINDVINIVTSLVVNFTDQKSNSRFRSVNYTPDDVRMLMTSSIIYCQYLLPA